MEKAGELMSFPCHGYVKKEDKEEHSAVKYESDESDETEVTNHMSAEDVPDFSCFSQAWGE